MSLSYIIELLIHDCILDSRSTHVHLCSFCFQLSTVNTIMLAFLNLLIVACFVCIGYFHVKHENWTDSPGFFAHGFPGVSINSACHVWTSTHTCLTNFSKVQTSFLVQKLPFLSENSFPNQINEIIYDHWSL